ncbi:MAG: glycerophosphodiester phosphodiesterase [Verrucomicrobia bacterium]|jgi:glycerophosphoryl diester phosphodiesterase|nr:glycerophosphodiester phosphodiesterase [Verrucomicrobiota bacterium]
MNDIPKVIAHRGASANAPENTLPAFALAWKEGADGVECDVRLTADGQVICFHDADTERVAGQKLEVASTDYAKLSELDVGSHLGASHAGAEIPLLSEMMAHMPPGKRLFIDLKSDAAIIDPLLEVIDAARVEQRQIALLSFDSEMVKLLKEQRPSLKAYWSIDAKSNWLGRSQLKLADVQDTLVDIRADGLGLRSHSGIKRDMVKSILESDVHLNIWTVDAPQEARRYTGLGVSSITTNSPRELLQAILGKNSIRNH